MKKKENKKDKLTESLNLTVEMKRRSNYYLNLRKPHINKTNAKTTKPQSHSK